MDVAGVISYFYRDSNKTPYADAYDYKNSVSYTHLDVYKRQPDRYIRLPVFLQAADTAQAVPADSLFPLPVPQRIHPSAGVPLPVVPETY